VSKQGRPTWVPAFVGLGIAWGCSFALIAVALEALSPVQVAFWRLALGAAALVIVSFATGASLPRTWTTWRHLFVVALLINAIPFTLFGIGQQYVSSTLAGILNAATPLATMLLTMVALRSEPVTRARAMGIVVGFIGLLVVLGAWTEPPQGQLRGIAACLAAILCYALAFIYSRRHLRGAVEGPISLATGQVLLATAVMLLVAVVTGFTPRAEVTPRVVVATICLGVFGSGLAYIANFFIIERAGPLTASSVTYLTPVVAAFVGITVLDETLEWHQPVGATLVLVGIAVAQRTPRQSDTASLSAGDPALGRQR
jgi:drug/metabolite transporter (DMT)-like permease